MIHILNKLALVRFLTEHHLLDTMIIASAGGIVNHFIHSELVNTSGKSRLRYFLKHLFISMFTGIVVGLLCVDFKATTTQTLLFAALAGTSGSELIIVLQKKFASWVETKQI